MQHLGFKIFQDGESWCVGNDGALFARIKKKRTSRYYKKKQCYQFDDIYDFTNPHASQMFQKFISARRLIHRQYLAKRETRHSFFFFFFFFYHSEAVSFQTVRPIYRGVHSTESVQQSIAAGPLRGGSNNYTFNSVYWVSHEYDRLTKFENLVLTSASE